MLVGTEIPDDAGVYRLGNDLAIVMTVDFFTPIVDDAWTYGEIAAANALSDVYAMGGEPFAALNVAAFPAKSEELPLSVLGEILEGGCHKAAEAGVVIIGGHTIDDPEPKYGLAVIGRVHPDRIVRKGGAQPGDRLILTKPLGTGILTTALKQGRIEDSALEEAVRSMTTLNRDAARAMQAVGVHAATDVTGFGLLGHLAEMLREPGRGAALSVAAVPTLPGARDLAASGVVPGGTRKNLDAVAPRLKSAASVTDTDRLLLADAQTSGGLLIAVPPARRHELIERLTAASALCAADIGEITASSEIRIEP